MRSWKLTLLIVACLQVAVLSKSLKKLKAIKRHGGFRFSCCFIDIFCSEVCIERGDRPTYKRSVSNNNSKERGPLTAMSAPKNIKHLLHLMKDAREFRRVWNKWYVAYVDLK